MLFDTEIAAVTDSMLPNVLAPVPLVALRGLVYRSKVYNDNRGYYGDVYAKIKEVAAAALAGGASAEDKAEGRVLGAVVIKLRSLPGISVESEGSADARSFFSSPGNWEELARDVLNALYLPIGSAGSGAAFISVTRNLPPCDLPRFWTFDEAYYVARGWLIR